MKVFKRAKNIVSIIEVLIIAIRVKDAVKEGMELRKNKRGR